MLSETQRLQIDKILNNPDLENNPAAKVSLILEQFDLVEQGAILIDFANRLLEIAQIILEANIELCIASLVTLTAYIKREKTIYEVQERRIQLFELEDALRDTKTVLAECLTEVIFCTIGVIHVNCMDALRETRLVQNWSSTTKTGSNAYRMAHAIGLCKAFNESDRQTIKRLDKNKIAKYRHAESNWQLQHLLNSLTLEHQAR